MTDEETKTNEMLLNHIQDPKNPIRSYAELTQRYNEGVEANSKKLNSDLPTDPKELLIFYNKTRRDFNQARIELQEAREHMENLITDNPKIFCKALKRADDAVKNLDLKKSQLHRILDELRVLCDSGILQETS